MRKLIYFSFITLPFFACQPEVIEQNNSDGEQELTPNETASSSATDPSDSSDCSENFILSAGDNTEVGTMVITNDDDSLYVTYNASVDWVLTETNLYIGDASNVPTNEEGTPQIDNFTHTAVHNEVTSYTVAVAIDPTIDCYFIASNATLALLDKNGNAVKVESNVIIEGNSTTIDGKLSAYAEYCLQDCSDCTYDPVSYDYFGGQHILMGSLDVTNDEDSLYITFNFSGNWYMEQTHLYVGDPNLMPINGGNNPIPGHFPYATEHSPLVQTYTYAIALEGLPDCFAIAAHSEATLLDENGNSIQSETGWSNGTSFSGNRWGWYSEYCTQHCE